MKHFSIAELTRSDTARSRGIDNTPPAGVALALSALIEKVLDPIREAYGKPIRVNSGYRSLALNKAVGGSDTSQHLRGEAADITADITAGNVAENRRLFALIKTLSSSGRVVFDQLIDEKGLSWIHISYRANGSNRSQILTIK